MSVAVSVIAEAETKKPVDAAASTAPASALTAELAAVGRDDPARPALRARCIEAWLPLAQHLARRYANRGEPLDDLTQVAVMGLIKAVDRYEADRGVEFTGFAIPTIVGELKRHFRDRTWSIRVPRRLQELRMAIVGANNTLTHTLGRSATVADIAGHLAISEEEVLEGLEGAQAYSTNSLNVPVNEESGREFGDTLGGLDAEFELAEMRVSLRPALACLDEREQRIVTLRFYGNLTQTEIAEQIGVSQMHVSRLLTKALTKMRRQIDGEA